MPDLFFFGGLNFITQNKQIYELFCSANLIFWRANFKISLINNIHLVLYWCDFFFLNLQAASHFIFLNFFFLPSVHINSALFLSVLLKPKRSAMLFSQSSYSNWIPRSQFTIIIFFFFLKRLACPSSYCSPFFWSIVF